MNMRVVGGQLLAYSLGWVKGGETHLASCERVRGTVVRESALDQLERRRLVEVVEL